MQTNGENLEHNYNDITNTINNTMKHKYIKITKKLHKLKNEEEKDTQHITNNFYKRIENLTNITFTHQEIQLLSKGLKYNLHHKHSNWIKTLALEVDTAINLLDTKHQEYMRQTVANKTETLIKCEQLKKQRKTTNKDKQAQHEKKLITNIKNKMKQNSLTITKADKRNTLIIIDINHYNQKIDNFITNNKYTKLNKAHTKQQKTIRTTINTCKTIIKQTDKWKYTNMNPEAPHIQDTMKLHKPAHIQNSQTTNKPSKRPNTTTQHI
jgi:hypothetical protein